MPSLEEERPTTMIAGVSPAMIAVADEIVKRGIVDRISPRHAARLLKRRRPQTPLHPLLVDAGTR